MAFEDAQFIDFTNGSGEPINDTNLNNLQKYMLLNAHPVGSYYWSSESTDPSRLFGGTWERVKDVFLYALGDSGSAGDTGGASTVTLSEAQLPNIQGSFTMHSAADATNIAGTSGKFSAGITDTNKYKSGGDTVSASGVNSIGRVDLNFGSGQAHDNMPPYIKAYCWKRTA